VGSNAHHQGPRLCSAADVVVARIKPLMSPPGAHLDGVSIAAVIVSQGVGKPPPLTPRYAAKVRMGGYDPRRG
jgi:hypothetical protein